MSLSNVLVLFAALLFHMPVASVGLPEFCMEDEGLLFLQKHAQALGSADVAHVAHDVKSVSHLGSEDNFLQVPQDASPPVSRHPEAMMSLQHGAVRTSHREPESLPLQPGPEPRIRPELMTSLQMQKEDSLPMQQGPEIVIRPEPMTSLQVQQEATPAVRQRPEAMMSLQAQADISRAQRRPEPMISLQADVERTSLQQQLDPMISSQVQQDASSPTQIGQLPPPQKLEPMISLQSEEMINHMQAQEELHHMQAQGSSIPSADNGPEPVFLQTQKHITSMLEDTASSLKRPEPMISLQSDVKSARVSMSDIEQKPDIEKSDIEKSEEPSERIESIARNEEEREELTREEQRGSFLCIFVPFFFLAHLTFVFCTNDMGMHHDKHQGHMSENLSDHFSDQAHEYRTLLGKFVESHKVKLVIMVLICCDCVFAICIVSYQVEVGVSEGAEELVHWMEMNSINIMCIFLIEQMIHALAFGRLFYKHFWYVMDLVVVYIALIGDTILNNQFDEVLEFIIFVRLWKVAHAIWCVCLAHYEAYAKEEESESEEELEEELGEDLDGDGEVDGVPDADFTTDGPTKNNPQEAEEQAAKEPAAAKEASLTQAEEKAAKEAEAKAAAEKAEEKATKEAEEKAAKEAEAKAAADEKAEEKATKEAEEKAAKEAAAEKKAEEAAAKEAAAKAAAEQREAEAAAKGATAKEDAS